MVDTFAVYQPLLEWDSSGLIVYSSPLFQKIERGSQQKIFVCPNDLQTHHTNPPTGFNFESFLTFFFDQKRESGKSKRNSWKFLCIWRKGKVKQADPLREDPLFFLGGHPNCSPVFLEIACPFYFPGRPQRNVNYPICLPNEPPTPVPSWTILKPKTFHKWVLFRLPHKAEHASSPFKYSTGHPCERLWLNCAENSWACKFLAEPVVETLWEANVQLGYPCPFWTLHKRFWCQVWTHNFCPCVPKLPFRIQLHSQLTVSTWFCAVVCFVLLRFGNLCSKACRR